MKTSHSLLLAAALLAVLASPRARAANAPWATGVSGTWSGTGNWTGGVVANGVSATATVGMTASGQTLTLTTSQTTGVLNASSTAGGVAILGVGSGTLVMDNGGQQSLITVAGATNSASSLITPVVMTEGGLRIVASATGVSAAFGMNNISASGFDTGSPQVLAISHAGSGLFSATNVADSLLGAQAAIRIEAGTISIVNNTSSGGLTVRNGIVRAGTTGLGSGVVTLGDASSSAGAATLALASGTYSNDIVVSSAGSATPTINPNVNGVNIRLEGAVSLGKSLSIQHHNGSAIELAGAISGTGGLTLLQNNGGINQVTLSGSNTFSGGVTFASTGVTLNVASANALGTGTLSFGTTIRANMQLDNTSGGALTSANNNALVLSNFSFLGTDDLNLGTGSVTVGPTSAIISVQNKKLTIGGVISGAGKAIGNAGPGILQLGAANTYTGLTSVGGILSVSSLVNGGTASSIGASTNAATNLILNRGTLLYTGGTTATDRLFTVGNGGASLDSSGSGALVFSNTGNIVSTDDVAITLGAGSATTGFQASGTIVNNINTSNLAVGMSISGVGLAAGTTVSQILDGNRIVLSNSATSSSTASSYTFGALDRTFTLSGSNTGNNTIAGNMTNSTTKTLGVTKSGSGKWILSGSNSYTGATAVNAGTLIIAGSISNSSAVTVGAGGHFGYNSAVARTGSITLNGSEVSRAVLSGTGAINTALVLDNVGDTLSPGNSPGILSLGVSQSWESFTYQWETNNFTGTTAGTDFDRIAITGSLALTGGTGDYVLDLFSLTALNELGNVANFDGSARSWIILTTTTGITGFDAADWSILTANFTSSPAWTGMWSVSQVGNDLSLNYSAIPEPGTSLMIALGLGLTVLLYRRRRPQL